VRLEPDKWIRNGTKKFVAHSHKDSDGNQWQFGFVTYFPTKINAVPETLPEVYCQKGIK
jgi:hypothetical protein